MKHFVHLRTHSTFSFLAGTATVDELVRKAASEGMSAVALTDTNGLYGVVPFVKACRERGVKPIFGAELDGYWDGTKRRVTLLARNQDGYRELSRILTRRHTDPDFDFATALKGLSENLYILSDDRKVLEMLTTHPYLRVPLPVARGRVWDERRFYLRSIAGRLDLTVVAAGEVYFLHRRDYFLHKLLTAMRTRTTIGTLPPGEVAPAESFFCSGSDVASVFRDDLGVIDATAEVAEDCDVELTLGKLRLPKFRGERLPHGLSDITRPAELLRELAIRGLKRRMKEGDIEPGEWQTALDVLDRELSVVEEKGLVDYFLICWDIVDYATSRGMRSLGRGSAGNSVLSYALGITHVNPIRFNLFFERFLNPEREGFPDLDIDFATEDRYMVLEYIFERYGEDNVAMIGTYSTFRARGAVREVARALGIPQNEISHIVDRVPMFASAERLDDACKLTPSASSLRFDEEPLRTILPLAKRIGGFPRNMSTHPCGIVVCPHPVSELVPLQHDSRGYLITQWSMHEIEEAGLLKMDIIGQKGLAVIQEASSMAEENEGRPIRVTVKECLGDEKTKHLLGEGATEGCFYIESPIMLQLLRQARCDSLEVLTALSSIIRPGVSNYGGKRLYLRRHLGLEEVGYLHPTLEDVLKDTYGCLIYQEQVIRIAVAVAGMSYAKADGLRRCMSFKSADDESMESYREDFLGGAVRKGIPPDVADEIFRQIASFAGYAFCKAHSASFALESFESLYWKAHYPAEFMAAVLSNGGGYYSAQEYIEEARRMGLVIHPPCVNRSRVRFYGVGQKLWVGLMQVKGLRSGVAERIVEGRPYRSLREFIEKVKPSTEEVETLIRCGAFSSFGRTRPELMWELRLILSGADKDLLSDIPSLPDYDLTRRIAVELEALGLAVSGHPLLMFAERLEKFAERYGLVSSGSLRDHVGEVVNIAGWLVTSRPTRTSTTGEEMLFVTFSDPCGRFDVVFFPDVYRRVAHLFTSNPGPFIVRGRVMTELGVESIEAYELVNILRKN